MGRIRTLQELCLVTISRSIDRYYHAYSTTDNDDQRRRFQFLQKIYSFELISILHNVENIQERYADLLFSEYLKSMHTKWLSKLSQKTIFEMLTKIGPNLETILFSSDHHVIQWKTIICHIPNVKSITYEARCNNDDLKYIAKYCPRLETLDAQRSYRVSTDGLKYFYQKEQGEVPCPLLKQIYVQSSRVNKKCIKQLVKNLPLLEDIEHYSELPDILYDLHKNDLGSLDKVKRYNFIHLDLLDYALKAHTKHYDDMLKICITVCPKLKAFYCPVSKLEHLNFCSLLLHLEDLDLNCVNDTHIEVNDVLKEKRTKLTSLVLRNCSVSLSVLGQCVQLNYLKMKQVKIQYDERDFIPMFYNLKTFYIKANDLPNPDTFKVVSKILACSPNLDGLYLKTCGCFTLEMKREILKWCEQCPLKLIDLGGTPVETDFLKDIILTCSTLENLHLDPYIMDEQMEDELRRFTWTLPSRPKISSSMELSESDYVSDY